MIFIFILFCIYIVQAENCDDKGEYCNACIRANCHFLVYKDNTTLCLTNQIFNALNFNNNRHLLESNLTEKTRCDDSNDNTNDKKPNGSNSSPHGGHEAIDYNTDYKEIQHNTIKPAIGNSIILHTDDDFNNILHVKVGATTAKTKKEATTKPTGNRYVRSTIELINTLKAEGKVIDSLISFN